MRRNTNTYDITRIPLMKARLTSADLMGFYFTINPNITVYRNLKPLLPMIEPENRIFNDVFTTISLSNIELYEIGIVEKEIGIRFNFFDCNQQKIIHFFTLNKKDAIKYAKTLRTQINKITESEGEDA